MKRKKGHRDRARGEIVIVSQTDQPLPTTYTQRSPNDFELITNVDSLRESSGIITGYIAFRLKDDIFPSAFWTERIIQVLSWWATDAADLLGKSRVKNWQFMEANCELRVEKQAVGSKEWTLQGFDAGRPCTIILTIDRAIVLREFLERGQELISACRKRSWNANLGYLESNIARIEREVELLE